MRPRTLRHFLRSIPAYPHGQPWFNRSHRALHRCFRPQTLHHIQCAQAATATLTLAGAGWIVSSFLWSCFPWRRLFSGELSRAPSWTAFSFAGGALFFPVFAVVKMWRLQDREATVDLGVFVQRQVGDCVVAVWWVNGLYVVLWMGLEILVEWS
jgi:hypothetical protein